MVNRRPRVVTQRGAGDCGVAALACLFSLTYEDAYVAVASVDRTRSRKGIWASTLIKAAATLGRTLVRRRRVDLDEDHGILAVRWQDRKRAPGGHYVVLHNGGIIDPQEGGWTPADEYLIANKGKVTLLLTEKV